MDFEQFSALCDRIAGEGVGPRDTASAVGMPNGVSAELADYLLGLSDGDAMAESVQRLTVEMEEAFKEAESFDGESI